MTLICFHMCGRFILGKKMIKTAEKIQFIIND